MKGYALATKMAEDIAADHGLTLAEIREQNLSQGHVECRDEIAWTLRVKVGLRLIPVGYLNTYKYTKHHNQKIDSDGGPFLFAEMRDNAA